MRTKSSRYPALWTVLILLGCVALWRTELWLTVPCIAALTIGTGSRSYAPLWIALTLLGGVALLASQLWPAVACFGITVGLYLFRRFLIRRVEQTCSPQQGCHDNEA